MLSIFGWTLLSVSLLGFAFFSYAIFRHIKKFNHYRSTVSTFESIKNRDMMDALEFATTDQLFKELNSRVRCPFIIIKPFEQEDKNGLSISVHNIEPSKSVAMINFAAAMTTKELLQRGVDISQFQQGEE